MSANVGTVSVETLQQELVDCQRQAILGSLTGIIAHEYNNLMTPVLARAQDALTRDDLAAMRTALTTTIRQTEKALRFTQQVLELARGRELPQEACRVVELVGDAIASAVRPFDKDGIELDLHVPDELHVRAQPRLFVQVLLNLLLNARHAMKGRRGTLSITASLEGKMAVIAVRDSGSGMSAERLEQVINPFLGADGGAPPDAGGAVGLGLKACRTIAHQHGATIRAFANDGAGCTFQLRWPAA